MTLEEFVDRLDGQKNYMNGQYRCRCPAHDDRVSSLSVGEDGEKLLIYCHAGCHWNDIIDAMQIDPRDLWIEDNMRVAQTAYNFAPAQPEAIYDYHDENGTIVFQVLRYPGKKFRQRRLTPDGWVFNMDGVKRVPYRLPQLLEAEEVWITEGEKDADRLNELFALLADSLSTSTCLPGGAGRGKFLARYVKYFKGANVYIVRDKDPSGEAYAEEIADALTGVAACVTVVEAKEGNDISNHLDAGLTLDEVEVVESDTVKNR